MGEAFPRALHRGSNPKTEPPPPRTPSRRDFRFAHQENINMPQQGNLHRHWFFFFWCLGVQAAPGFVLLTINENWAAQKVKLHLSCLPMVTALLTQDPSVCCTQWDTIWKAILETAPSPPPKTNLTFYICPFTSQYRECRLVTSA